MKLIVILAVVAVAVADKLAAPPVLIVRSQQVDPDATGAHSSDFESENGIKFQVSGSQGANGGSNMIGSWSYPQEDGSVVSVQFVADENGYQPQSDQLPVAPIFPHVIPQFVLDQIAFAEKEKKLQEQGN
ncbi:cuticle protein AM1274 [Cherax quadricarinatus]|uniref:cuticle protein AM1274 n=1 Tax=Cherax quadricarinatus TaxID=27406 RepID=UPI0023787C46|nr:cuticle protein AM1274-like [Cherax quadricarinatus]